MTKRGIIFGFLGILSMPFTANGGLISGVLNFTGTANISFGSIGFLGNDFFVNSPAGAQQGDFTILAGTTGTIANITNPPDATGPLNVPLFMTFNSAPNISITLTFLLPGIDGAAGCTATPAAAGQQCTPNLPDQSPFNLQNTSATSSTASFNILGYEVDTISGNSVPITAAFSTQFTTMNYQQVLSTILGDGTVTTSFSGQLATVPEPSTLIELSLGLGIAGIGGTFRRKFIKNLIAAV
jgi:hypothetical protein